MKIKTALILTMALTLLFAANVPASSYNSINKTVTVRDGASIDGVYLKIEPNDEILEGDSIILTFTNAKIKENLSDYSWDSLNSGGTGITFNSLLNDYYESGTEAVNSFFTQTGSASLPYRLTQTGNREMEAELFPLPSTMAGTNSNSIGITPYYSIPLAVYSDGEGAVTVSIDSNDTTISGWGSSAANIYTKPATQTTAATETSTETTTEAATQTTTETTAETTTEAPVPKTVVLTIGSKEGLFGNDSFILAAPPYIQNNTSSAMVPLRFVTIACNVLSGKALPDFSSNDTECVKWDAETKTALITAPNGSIIAFTAGSSTAVVNGTPVQTANNAVVEIVNNSMYVPFRTLGEFLDVLVEWNSENKTIIYNMK